MQSAELLVGDRPSPGLDVELAPLVDASASSLPLREGGVSGAYAVCVDEQQCRPRQPRRVRSVRRDRRELVDCRKSRAQSDREQQPAGPGREPSLRVCPAGLRSYPARACPRRCPAGRPSASVRPTSSANNGFPSVESTMPPQQRPREAQPEPLVQELPDGAAGSAGRPRGARAPSARSPARAGDVLAGALGEQEADGGRPRAGAPRTPALRPTGDRATARRRSRSGAARRRPARAACSGNRARSPAARVARPSGSARRTRHLERSPLRSVQLAELLGVDPVETGRSSAGECQPRLGAPLARVDEHPAPCATRSGDAGLPERRLADPRAAREDKSPRASRGEELVQGHQFRLSPDRFRPDAPDEGQGRPPKPLIPQPRGHQQPRRATRRESRR